MVTYNNNEVKEDLTTIKTIKGVAKNLTEAIKEAYTIALEYDWIETTSELFDVFVSKQSNLAYPDYKYCYIIKIIF